MVLHLSQQFKDKEISLEERIRTLIHVSEEHTGRELKLLNSIIQRYNTEYRNLTGVDYLEHKRMNEQSLRRYINQDFIEG